jgi:sugar lactone lactonase YvrE
MQLLELRVMKTIKLILVVCSFLCACMAVTPITRINFTAPDTYPEGLTYDSLRNVYYVSSARKGTIGMVTPEGEYAVLYADSSLKSTYGLKIHPDGSRLFVCVGDANYSKYTAEDTRMKMARLISIDLDDGKKLTDVDLSGLVPGKHFPNDLVFDQDENIYITDSYAHAIYKVTPEGQASVFAKDKRFETEGVGVNGIVYHPKGYLLVDNSNTGRIYKIAINNPENVFNLDINQYFLGADGLLLQSHDTLTVVVNGGNNKIYQLKTEDNWKSARLCGTTSLLSNAVPSQDFAIQLATFKNISKRKAK